MSPTRHPSDATLIGFGSGTLSESAALVVACHLTVCPECRRNAAIVNALGGIMLDEAPPMPFDANRLIATLSRLDAPPAYEPRHEPSSAEPGLPAPLHRYTLGRWWWIGPGISQIVIVRGSARKSSARLLRLAPHAAMPYHGHSGAELACVLRGSFSDERGRFAAGDVSEADEGVHHRPIADPEVGCICLVATSGPLRLYGLIGRLMQRLLRL